MSEDLISAAWNYYLLKKEWADIAIKLLCDGRYKHDWEHCEYHRHIEEAEEAKAKWEALAGKAVTK